jgi:hypothetical protein
MSELSPVEQQRADVAAAIEQQPASVPDAQDAPTSEAAETPTEVDSGGEADPEQQEADKALKRGKNYYARKIDALTREREQERQRADQALRVLEQAVARGQSPQPQAQQAQAPQREHFQDYESYLEARAEFKAQQAAVAMQQQFMQRLSQIQGQSQIQQQATQVAEQFQSKLAEGVKAYDDWSEVVEGEGADLHVGHAAAAIAQAENPAGVMYWLAKNRHATQRIAQLDPIRAAIEIGKIDANLQATRKVSTAPKPGRPANAKGGSLGGFRDDMSMDEFIAARRKR